MIAREGRAIGRLFRFEQSVPEILDDFAGRMTKLVALMLLNRSFLLVCLWCAAALAVPVSFAQAPAGTLLVPNRGFEIDADGDRWPDQWGRAKVGGTWEIEDGNHFIRLTSTEPGQMVMLYQQVRIPESVRALELSFRMRVNELTKGKQAWFDARILMDFKDAAGKKRSGAPAPNSGKNTEGWVERKVQFLVPEGAVTLDFMPALFNVESGTLDLDDVVLQPTDPAPLEEKAKADAAARRAKEEKDAAARRSKATAELAKQGSLISNGDFEADVKKADQWPDEWGRAKGATWEI